jgi:hypothetical protein
VVARESDPRVVEALKKRYSFEEWYKTRKREAAEKVSWEQLDRESNGDEDGTEA